jgi:hypothetical protein
VAEHHVEAARAEPAAALVAVAAEQLQPAPDLRGFRGERPLGDAERDRVRVDPGDVVAGPGQPQRLGALPAADVEDPLRAAPGELFGELAGDELLADEVAQSAEPVQPGAGAAGEGAAARGQPALLGEPVMAAVALPRERVQAGPLPGRGGPAGVDRFGGQGFSPRRTCGLGRRSRRICRVRMMP